MRDMLRDESRQELTECRLTSFMHGDQARGELEVRMNYELYRRSTIGLALTDALDDLIQNQQLTPHLAMKVLYQFDRTMVDILTNRLRTRGTIKGHLNVYRYLDGVWTFVVDKYTLKLEDEIITGDRLKIVACDAKKAEAPNPQ